LLLYCISVENPNQKLFKKSTAFKMGILRNGFKISKSLSPVMIQEALADTANYSKIQNNPSLK